MGIITKKIEKTKSKNILENKQWIEQKKIIV